jgi:hypothetical protein
MPRRPRIGLDRPPRGRERIVLLVLHERHVGAKPEGEPELAIETQSLVESDLRLSEITAQQGEQRALRQRRRRRAEQAE